MRSAEIRRKTAETDIQLALDLDGTLLTGKKTILPASLDALARASADAARLV